MKFFTTSSTDAHTALRVRCAGMDALSLSFHKERAKERELKGLMPLRTPKTFLFRYLLVVTKRRCRICEFCATKSKDFVAAASRLSLSLHTVPRFNEKQEKDIFDLIHRPPCCHHARQAGKIRFS